MPEDIRERALLVRCRVVDECDVDATCANGMELVASRDIEFLARKIGCEDNALTELVRVVQQSVIAVRPDAATFQGDFLERSTARESV